MSEGIEYTEVSPEGVEAHLATSNDYVTSSTRTSDSPDLRVSQINGCAHGVDMHARALINKGVSADKLVLVPLWREASSLFDKRVAMTAAFAQSESNSIRCLTTEIVNQRYPFTNRGNMP
jgi:AhpD family alkylhydroperoxidase